MGYEPFHIYLVTHDERYREDFDKQMKHDLIALSTIGIVLFLGLLFVPIYVLCIYTPH